MKYAFTILIGLFWGACHAMTASKNLWYNSDTIKTEIIVKNKADYAHNFIEGLKTLGYEKIELIDSLLIINGYDTVYFPETPNIGKQAVLTGKKGDLALALTIKRLNYTTLEYKIEMVEFGKTSYTQHGQADIISGFFFGDESDESEKTGLAYFVTAFIEYKEKGCYTQIRLGYEAETGPYLLGKLIKNCNGKIMDIGLDNFTTLVEK